MPSHRYAVTYAFDGCIDGGHAEAVERIDETIARMRAEGETIDLLGATQEFDAAGRLVEMSARYAAPSKGAVGRLNCRARLPATGGARREPASETESPASATVET